MRVGILAITRGGQQLARTLADQLPGSQLLKKGNAKISELLAESWPGFDAFVCIMATGIVVRAIAPLLQDKRVDPCIVVIDEKGRHAISLLSGHLGGGNQLAKEVALITGGVPVITTASDTLELTALDLWARTQNLVAESSDQLTTASTLLVNRGSITVFSDVPVEGLPPGLALADNAAEAHIIITNRKHTHSGKLILHPRNLVVGVGCNRGTPLNEFEEALDELFGDLQLSTSSIRNLASIDKKNDEIGLLEFASANNWTIDFFDSTTINSQTNLEISFAALNAVGAIGVAEPAALLSAGSNILFSRKRKWKNVTMAIAQAPFTLSAQVQGQ